MSKTIFILVGNIASGKSTLSREYVHIRESKVISRDAIRYMIGAGTYIFNPVLEPAIYQGTKALLEAFLKSGVEIVYDECNVSKSSRRSTIQLAKKYDYEVIAIELPKLSKEISVNRRLKDCHGPADRYTWNMVWDKFNSSYEHPSTSEGFDKVIEL